MSFADSFIDFQEHMGKLKHLRRTGWVDCGISKAETVASHSWRMAMMALQLEAKLSAQGYDVDKLIEICLLHDCGEAVIGDIVPEEYVQKGPKVSKEAKKRLEMKAVISLSESYHFPLLLERFSEYETGNTPEAAFAKELDKLDMLLQSYEYRLLNPKIAKLDEFLVKNRHLVTKPFLKEVVDEIADRYAGLLPRDNLVVNNFIKFQMACGNLKHLERTGPQMYDIPNPETVAGHSWRSAVMILQLKDREAFREINAAEAVRLLLVHDLGEVVIGDIVPEKWQKAETKISAKEKKKREIEAIAWLAREYKVRFLWKGFYDFEKQVKPAARLAKDVEIYESIQQAYEYIKIYPEKEILQEFIPFHQPRIGNEEIVKIIGRLAQKQRKFLSHITKNIKACNDKASKNYEKNSD